MNILIAGTGKMGRDIGLFLLAKGESVTWASRNNDSVEKHKKSISKAVHRIEIIASVHIPDKNFTVETYGNISGHYDLVIENIIEDLQCKQEIFNQIKSNISEKPILTSNSSSILPERMANNVIGLHFFYPIEMAKIVEVIFPAGVLQSQKEKLLNWLENLGLEYLVQTEKNAFAVNRLLLPVQAEVFNLLISGIPADIVETCSTAGLFPFGQLTFMDSVGLDVLMPAVKNYTERYKGSKDTNFENLIYGLNQLLTMGKLGRKNRNGLLVGDSLPWKTDLNKTYNEQELEDHFKKIFMITCSNFLADQQFSEKELNLVLNNIFNINKSWRELIKS
jgi:3-hydroxyacyl-CoA dehydrogenase